MAPFLMGADGSGSSADEEAALREQRQALIARVDVLVNEQDFLLFQKAMYASDSKYLVLDRTRGTGRLMYKSRVLKEFRFRRKNAERGEDLTGKLSLSRKAEGKRGHHVLFFGNALIVQWKRTVVPPNEAAVPTITLAKDDMLAVFYALEDGALAYYHR